LLDVATGFPHSSAVSDVDPPRPRIDRLLD
jgi:hypothetical protein